MQHFYSTLDTNPAALVTLYVSNGCGFMNNPCDHSSSLYAYKFPCQSPASVLTFEGTKVEGAAAIVDKYVVSTVYRNCHHYLCLSAIRVSASCCGVCTYICLQKLGQLHHNIPQLVKDIQVRLHLPPPPQPTYATNYHASFVRPNFHHHYCYHCDFYHYPHFYDYLCLIAVGSRGLLAAHSGHGTAQARRQQPA